MTIAETFAQAWLSRTRFEDEAGGSAGPWLFAIARHVLLNCPACTVVTEGVEDHCTLDKPPVPEVTDFKGTVYQTVDATQHVNGGCRGLTSDGLVWECWIGEAAVEQKIISEGFLGEVQTVPAVG